MRHHKRNREPEIVEVIFQKIYDISCNKYVKHTRRNGKWLIRIQITQNRPCRCSAILWLLWITLLTMGTLSDLQLT